jgi:hypothetical protein
VSRNLVEKAIILNIKIFSAIYPYQAMMSIVKRKILGLDKPTELY